MTKTTPCRKVEYRIECYRCGYPLCEAQWPDAQTPLACDSSDRILEDHVKKREALEDYYGFCFN